MNVSSVKVLISLVKITVRFYIGSKFNVVVCDMELIREIMIDNDDKLQCGGPCMVRGLHFSHYYNYSREC